MTLKERCQAGEAKLEQISSALLDPRPEILEHCEGELQEVIAMLSESVDSAPRPVVLDRSELLKLRHRTRLVGLQVQNAIHLCQGWSQLGLSQGYTDQGRPAVPPSEPQASYEV
jgi:hypothetical protein